MTNYEKNVRDWVLTCANAALDKKARQLVILNVRDYCSFADYFVICSGTSDRQVQAISSSIQEIMKKAGQIPLGVEGESNCQWVLLDYAEVIVHVFLEPVREFYNLENLWSDAPRRAIADEVNIIDSLDEG